MTVLSEEQRNVGNANKFSEDITEKHPIAITWGNPCSQCKSQVVLGASLRCGEDVCSSPVQSYGSSVMGTLAESYRARGAGLGEGHSAGYITLGGNGEVAMGRGRAGVSRGAPTTRPGLPGC